MSKFQKLILKIVEEMHPGSAWRRARIARRANFKRPFLETMFLKLRKW